MVVVAAVVVEEEEEEEVVPMYTCAQEQPMDLSWRC